VSKIFSHYLSSTVMTFRRVDLQTRVRVTRLHQLHPCKQSCSTTLIKFIIITPKSVFILHNEELNDLYCSPNLVRVIKSRTMRWTGHVARREEGRGVHKVLVGKPEGKRPLGRPRRRWEDNIKLYLQEVGRVVGTD
jgi:hypothetical protein